MDTITAIKSRHSVRDFKKDPVPRDTIIKIMEAAIHSPSGGNSQPWEVFIAAGAAIERIRAACQAAGPVNPGGPGPGGIPSQPAYIMERMAIIRRERMVLLGLNPDDPASGKVFTEWSTRLYNAPVMAVICMDKALNANLDLGLFVQTICLAAQSYGVDSLIAGAFVMRQDILRKELGIPESLNIVTGVGLGYANPGAVINTYRSPRRPVNEVVRYKDK